MQISGNKTDDILHVSQERGAERGLEGHRVCVLVTLPENYTTLPHGVREWPRFYLALDVPTRFVCFCATVEKASITSRGPSPHKQKLELVLYGAVNNELPYSTVVSVCLGPREVSANRSGRAARGR